MACSPQARTETKQTGFLSVKRWELYSTLQENQWDPLRLIGTDIFSSRHQRPTMALISAFLEQTIYLGMPDESVCNPLVFFFQLLRPTTLFFFSFFPLSLALSLSLFLWYVLVEKFFQELLWGEASIAKGRTQCVGSWKVEGKEGKKNGVEQKDKGRSAYYSHEWGFGW